MHKHCTVHFSKGALPLRTPAEAYFLDPELGHQKGRGAVWGRRKTCRGWASRREKLPALTREPSA